ncbi:MAG TPA: HlyD family secretion protein [Terriglobales bacterium]|nr:HlyD family secretion protein [Terriglobales bacterium]
MAPEAASAITTEPAKPTLAPVRTAEPDHLPVAPRPNWLKYLTPILVVLLAGAILFTITRNWNSWEGGRIEQVTDDAYVRGDLTPLSTKVAGIVREVKVSDFQAVHRGDLLVQLDDDDYRAQVSQASAAVAAAKAAIENNRRQKQLQQAKIDRALAGVSQAQAEISAAQAGIAAAQADLDRTVPERHRQEALIETNSTTRQKVEQVVADDERARAQLVSRQASLEQAKAMLTSNQSAVDAERRGLDVVNSQELQLIADLQGREAALTVSQVNLGYTKIYAPGDGTVGERQVRPGQLVSPGTQVIPFVDKTKWVQANYRETQLTNVKVGDPAEIRIDQYPGRVFNGKIIEIAPASGSQFALLPPDNATGNYTKVVQRIPVKIAFDDEGIATTLRPGLSVITTVRTRR